MRPATNGNESETRRQLRRIYTTLLAAFGPQGWWPARIRLEVILGAILTQNTAWKNAALAVRRLRQAGMLNHEKLSSASLSKLESLIRPAGFFRQKARTIRNFLRYLETSHGGSLRAMFSTPGEKVRRELLALKGLGPETADAILLYAGGKTFFVADAYSRRVLARHDLWKPTATYSEAQQVLHEHLPGSAALFNEFHALLVEAGKRYCKREVPRCEACPLEPFLNHRHVARPDHKGFAFAKPPAVSGVSGRVGPTLKRMELSHHLG